MLQRKFITPGLLVLGLAVVGSLLLSNISTSAAFGTVVFKGGNVTTCYNTTPEIAM